MAEITTCNCCGRRIATFLGKDGVRKHRSHVRNTNPMGLGPNERCPGSNKKAWGYQPEKS